MKSSSEPSTTKPSGDHGWVLDVLRNSIHDGPGIRTTVFLKGCPLRCVWCHNPESQATGARLSFVAERCRGCGACVAACPHGAQRVAGGRAIDRARCRDCGACVAACPTDALSLLGAYRSADEVLDEVLADRAFYEASGGGMTLSGGEPFAQPAFARTLLRRAKEAGIRTAVETCGFVSPDILLDAAPLVDLFLYDCKGLDDAKHRENTGVSNALILENLHRLAAQGSRILLRCPLIPGKNDSDEDLRALADFRAALGDAILGLEVMPYHHGGNGKAVHAGLPVRFEHADATPAEKDRWNRLLGL